jgi:acyl-CoA synthetase (NDP forming)
VSSTAAVASADSDALRRALFEPASVALVGASNKVTSAASRPLAYLRRWNFRGRVYPVNARSETVLGEHAWPSISSLPETPDHVFVMTPTAQVLDVVAECAARGVPIVTVLASGFSEDGEAGATLTAQLLRVLEGTGTRLLGPSSLGIVNLRNGLTLTANAAFSESGLPVGSTLALSQSGSMIGALVSRGKSLGIGFASLVSVGNEVDLDVGQICESTLDDPTITSYALFLETIKGAPALQRFAEGARLRGKPVVAYKLGRSSAGAELALSHTGALAGEDEVAAAFFADCAIARVKTLDGLLESVALAHRIPVPDRPRRPPRVGVVTTTGGGAAMVVDQLGVLGIDVTPPSPATFERFAEAGAPAKPGRIVDLTLAGTRYEVMCAALQILVDAQEHDVVIVVVGSSARFEPEIAVRPIVEFAERGMPIAAFLVPDAPEGLAMLNAAAVPAFRSPESCADAVAAVLSRRRREIPLATVGTPIPPDRPRHMLDELAAYAVLERIGVPHAPACVIDADTDTAPALPFDYPVVAKVLSADIAHKTDVGGVILDIADEAALTVAARQIRAQVAEHRPELGPVPILVQPMVGDASAEVLIGYRCDRQAGPIVLLAPGGELTEIYEDRCIRLAPVDLETAYDMISSVRSLRVLEGFRSRPPADVDALAHAIVAVSQLSQSPTVTEAEINPLIVRRSGSGVVAVDALIAAVADERTR